MKVHIIRNRAQTTDILSRKAQVLSDRLGWTMGAQPDPAADLQYAFCYIDYKDPKLPFAAYFTHREDMRPDKVQLWQDRASSALLRVTSAQQYFEDLQQYGAAVKILPPLDREKFALVPGKQQNSGSVAVGVAGYVYTGGRKGEEYLQAAIDREPDGIFKWRAMGKGWPVPCRQYDYKDIQKFYQSLDIYLCTSTIEGVPYPPLEALACGTKIVIPWGVGLMDELPDIPGIERYQAGNVEDMLAALHRCAEAKVEPEQLRAATEPFDQEAWAQQHADAFAEVEQVLRHTSRSENATAAATVALNGERAARQSSDRGVYVAAFGTPARACASELIYSLRKFMPGLPVAVASEEPLPEADYHIAVDEPGPGARLAKLQIYDLAPKEWRYVLYMDADTEITEPIDHLFWCLEQGWEAVFVKEVTHNHRHIAPGRGVGVTTELNDYNLTLDAILQPEGNKAWLSLGGGIISFKRCAAAKRLFDRWFWEYCYSAQWPADYKRDQPSLLRAWFAVKIKALVLGSEWNSFTHWQHENRCNIIRHHGGRARGSYGHDTGGQVQVKNMSDNAIERGGYEFLPGSTVLCNARRKGFNEVRACKSLQIVRK